MVTATGPFLQSSMVYEEPNTQNLSIQVENTITQEFVLHKTGIVVLSIGAEPAEGTDELGQILGIIKDERTGFFAVSNEDDVSVCWTGENFLIC